MKPFQPKGETSIVSSLVSGPFSSPRTRTLLGICFMMLLSIQSYGQDDWTLFRELDGVQVFYHISDCDNQESLDPLDMGNAIPAGHTFQLKFVNSNPSSRSVSFSKITKTDGSDEMESISISSGITLLDSCDDSPKMILTQQSGDNYPVAVTDFLEAFKITIND